MTKVQLLVIAWIIALSGIVQTGCSTVQFRQAMKEHSIIVKPGKNLRPRTYEDGIGNTEYLDTLPVQGDAFMIIIRGKL